MKRSTHPTQWNQRVNGYYAVVTKVATWDGKKQYELELTDANGRTVLSYHNLRREAVSRFKQTVAA